MRPNRFALPLIALVALAGCAPASRFRRAAHVPMPTGDSLTQPQEGLVDVSGSITHQNSSIDLFPELGDPALQASNTTFYGEARFRLGRFLRLGLQGTYSHSSLAQPTATGTPPMEDSHLFGLGPSFSFNYRQPKWALGAGISATFLSTPWSTWERRDGTGDFRYDPSEIFLEDYRLTDEGRDLMVLLNASVGATYIPLPSLEIFGGLSVQNSLDNIGFSNEGADGSTISAGNFGVVPFVGVTGRIPQGGYLRFQYFLPIGFGQFESPNESNWGGIQGTIGWDIRTEEAK